MFRLALIASLVFSANAAWSKGLTQTQRDHLTPVSVSVQELPTSGRPLSVYTENFREAGDSAPVPVSPAPSDGLDLGKIINIGKEIWKIIDAGKPVVDIKYDTASAVPSGTKSWDQLSDWKAPVAKYYQVAFKNKFGAEVTRFDFRMLYTYGGSVGGVGRYLTSIKVIPANVNVMWGYDLKAETLVPSVVNVGTAAAPMAGAEIMVHWRVKTVLKYVEQTMSFFVTGDGVMQDKSVTPVQVTNLNPSH